MDLNLISSCLGVGGTCTGTRNYFFQLLPTFGPSTNNVPDTPAQDDDVPPPPSSNTVFVNGLVSNREIWLVESKKYIMNTSCNRTITKQSGQESRMTKQMLRHFSTGQAHITFQKTWRQFFSAFFFIWSL